MKGLNENSGVGASSPSLDVGRARSASPLRCVCTIVVVLAALAACRKESPGPELLFGTPGDPARCTLAAPKAVFEAGEPMALVVEMHRPLGREQVELLTVRVDESGVERDLVWRKPFQVMREHERFCIVDPDLVAATFTGVQTGRFAMRLLGGTEVLAQAPFEVTAPPPEQTPVPAPEEKSQADEAADQ